MIDKIVTSLAVAHAVLIGLYGGAVLAADLPPTPPAPTVLMPTNLVDAFRAALEREQSVQMYRLLTACLEANKDKPEASAAACPAVMGALAARPKTPPAP